MSRQSRIKAQKKRKVLKKKRSAGSAFSPFHFLNAELPLYGAYVLDLDLKEVGTTNVIIARKMVDGNIVFGSFLVDVWGVGLKDCFGDMDVPPRQFEQKVLKRHPDIVYKPCDLGYAQRLLWGGVEHAKTHGFKLPKEFQDWRKIVGQPPVDTPPIEFGKDGKLFVIGELNDIARRMGTSPDEAMARINQKGHFLVGMQPAAELLEDLVEDEEVEPLEEAEDSDIDPLIKPVPRRTIWYPGQK